MKSVQPLDITDRDKISSRIFVEWSDSATNIGLRTRLLQTMVYCLSAYHTWNVVSLPGEKLITFAFSLANTTLFSLIICRILTMISHGCQYQCNQLPLKTSLQCDLLCVEWDVKPYMHTCPRFMRTVLYFGDLSWK